jgi:hypothetical protein
MEFVRLILDGNYGDYSYKHSSSIEMDIIGCFFTDNVGCKAGTSRHPTYQDWARDDSLGSCVSGNMIELEKEGEYIFLQDIYSQESEPTRLKMSRAQLVQLLDEWQEKVCKLKPKEVIIKCENGEFSIETKD